MELYDFLLLVHVLAAVVWVGGGIALSIVGTRLSRQGSATELAGFTRQSAFVGSRIFAPASGLLFLAGVYLTIQAFSFKDLWIAIGVAGFAYSFLTGAAILGPLSARTGKMLDDRGADDPQVRANIAKLMKFSRIEAAVMVVVIAAMTLKPTL